MKPAEQSETLRTAAHDLRGPLSAIVLFSELLKEDADQPAEAKQELLINIRSASQLASRFIEDLLDASTGELRLSVQAVDLVALASSCLALRQPAANQKGVRLRLQCEAPRITVNADRLKIQRVIDELLNNAIRCSNAEQTVELRLSVCSEFVEIAVQDEGPGIPREDLKKLFKPFAKEGRARAAGERGLGLGLAIANRIVAGHKGRIQMKSRPGAGSTFMVVLPRSRREGGDRRTIDPLRRHARRAVIRSGRRVTHHAKS